MVIEKQAPGEVLAQWLKVLRMGYWPGPVYPHRGYNVVEARNAVTARFLEGDAAALYWTDSDMLPDPGLADRLEELMQHPAFTARDGGVIVGSYYGRELPFEIQLFEPHPDVEGMRFLSPARWVPELMEAKQNYLKNRAGRLIKVGGGGTGSMLIRRDVLERMQERKGRGRVWEIKPLPERVHEQLRARGEDRPGGSWTEDIWFCVEVRRALGVQVLADTDLRLSSGHVTQQIVGPDHYLAAHTVPDKVVLDTAALERAGYRPLSAPAPAKS